MDVISSFVEKMFHQFLLLVILVINYYILPTTEKNEFIKLEKLSCQIKIDPV